ncbi:hypothetical protein DFH09DRAFT_1287588 [Mycena vulgaris]|nr:hypothetical protein DFH09DRAFT_1287588 [Mycena vulgaris]
MINLPFYVSANPGRSELGLVERDDEREGMKIEDKVDPDNIHTRALKIITRILLIAPFTILVYEYILTFEREVTRYWGTPFSWGTLFFYLNRYSPLFGTIPVIVQYYSTTTDPAKIPVCKAFRAYHQYFALLSQVLVAVMLIMRTFALYGRNKMILAFMILITLGAFAFAIWVFLSGTEVHTLSPEIAAFGCPLGTPHAKSLRLATAWSGMLVFDVMIFGLTLFKALRGDWRRSDLLTILIRDGSIYFALMILSNAGNIGTYTMGGPFISGAATTVTNITSSVMISRLMLNLRDPAIRLPHRQSRTSTYSTSHGGGAHDPPAITTLGPYESEYVMNTRWTMVDE